MERLDLDLWSSREVARLLSLVENERRYYQAMIATLPVSLAVVAEDLLIQSVNRAFRRQFGLSHGEVGENRLEECIPAGPLLDAVKTVFRSGQACANLSLVLAGHGTFRVNVLPMADWGDESRPEALIVLEDLSPGRAPDPPLVNAADAIYWETDSTTGKTWIAGQKARQLLGRTAENWNGRVHWSDRERMEALWKEAAQRDQTYTAEYRADVADGSAVWLRDVLRAVRDSATQQWKLTGVTEDITLHKQHAEQRVQSEKMDALARLSGRLAHDFNNLLLIINGFGEDLLHTLAMGDPRRGDLEEVLRAADRMAGIGNQLLTISRPQPVRTRTVDINRLVDLVERRLEGELPAHMRLQVTLGGVGLTALVDAAQIEQCLAALAVHVAHSQPEKTRLQLTASKFAFTEDAADGMQRGDYAAVQIGELLASSVVDTNAFEPFAAKGAPRESALGLAPLYAVLRQNHADVLAYRAESGQACFRIQIPLASPTAEAQEKAPVAKAASATALPGRYSETILVVDDEEGIRRLIGKILARQGYQILEAASAAEAKDIAGQYEDTIHLAVSDVVLPDIDGPELVEQLRIKRPQLRVLYISGYTENLDLYSGTLPPGIGFLPKPFTLPLLLNSVRALLDTKAGASATS